MAPGQIKQNNILPLWGNEKTMNLNSLILTNIQSSHYFKVNLYELKTYHEVIDEIYYKVGHLEPWEKGSRKTAGQTGMCGGVRGVGAGGIVSSAYCLLYKLFTLKLTRKQVNGLITHTDSPFIRGLGFMYIRYTQPPSDLWDWYVEYLDDEEEIDPKAGGGSQMTVGNMVKHLLAKLDWFSSLFPRIPVPIQKDIERKLNEWKATHQPVVVVEEPVVEKYDKNNRQLARDDRRHESRDTDHSRIPERRRRDDDHGDEYKSRHQSEKHRRDHRDDRERHGRRVTPDRSNRRTSRNGDISDEIAKELTRQKKDCSSSSSSNRHHHSHRDRSRDGNDRHSVDRKIRKENHSSGDGRRNKDRRSREKKQR